MAAAFEPTDAQRQMVETMSGIGMRQDDIRSLVVNPKTGFKISSQTFANAFDYEIERGMARANAKVLSNLFRIATSEEISGPVVTAAIFLAKARCGFRTVDRMELTGANGDPITIQGAREQLRDKIDRLIGRDDENVVPFRSNG